MAISIDNVSPVKRPARRQKDVVKYDFGEDDDEEEDAEEEDSGGEDWMNDDDDESDFDI